MYFMSCGRMCWTDRKHTFVSRDKFTSRHLGLSRPTPLVSATLIRVTRACDDGQHQKSGAYHFDSSLSMHLNPQNRCKPANIAKPYWTKRRKPGATLEAMCCPVRGSWDLSVSRRSCAWPALFLYRCATFWWIFKFGRFGTSLQPPKSHGHEYLFFRWTI